MVKRFQMRYDDLNGRYVEPESKGLDHKVWLCRVYLPTFDGDLVMDGTYLFTEIELNHMKEV